MKRILNRLFGKTYTRKLPGAGRPGDFYKAHRLRFTTWQAVKPWDALNISLRYGYDNVAWGRW